MEIKIAHFYPDLLNLYGDKGNIAALKKRCEWRGIKADVINISLNDEVVFSDIDIALIGGGTDKDQLIVLERLSKIRSDILSYIENDGVMLALCGSFPVFCKKTVLSDKETDGLGIIDAECKRDDKRLISNVVSETPFGRIAGFENHSERVYLKNGTPFGKLLYGYGNNGEDGFEGIIYKNFIASFLHGPLLPKNPALCDELIFRALTKKYKDFKELEKLDDSLEYNAQKYIFDRFIKE